ncbi:hypothetical protein [Halobellus captivus]|uniref:hypothetical protein n=1 Tax=Halobellus captivus TaxID=2592614 RepID=UPI00119EA062|nr:hypothetical protein [Halobellus captivus]
MSKIHLFENSSRSQLEDNELDIVKLINSRSQKNKTKIFSEIHSKLAVESENFPIFLKSTWTKFTNPTPGNQSELIKKIVLYEELQNADISESTETIVCHNLSSKYECVVHDFCIANNINISITNSSKVTYMLRQAKKIFVTFIQLSAILLEQLLFGFIGMFKLSTNRKIGDQIFIPNPNRYESIKPVAEELGIKTLVVPWPYLLLQWKRNKLPSNNAFISINQFSSIISAPYSLKIILATIINRKKICDDLSEIIELQRGYRLPRSVAFSVNHILVSNVFCLCYCHPAKEMVNTLEPKSLVIGSPGIFSLPILTMANQQQGVETFHIPHSITRPFEPILPDTTQFLSSVLGLQYIQKIGLDIGDNIPVGRPYFKEITTRDVNRGEKCDKQKDINVLIGTQPFLDDIKQDLIDMVLVGANRNPHETNIRIKIHPSESVEWYDDCTHIPIYEDKLEENLKWADLTITINSNIGVEAVLNGSAVFYVNVWEGKVNDFPLVLTGKISHFTNRDNFLEAICKMDQGELRDTFNQQYRYITSQFALDSNISSDIKKELK